MKRAEKNWLIAAAALMVLGILVFCIAMTRNHWDFSALSTSNYETRTVDVNGAVRDISIRSDTENIVFLPSDGGKCRVVFYEPEKTEPAASLHDGTLYIETVDTRSWYERFTLFSLESPKITVILPEGEYASLMIEESTGNLAIPKDFTFESIQVSVSTGDVDCFASASGLIRIKTGTGDIHVENLSAGALSLSVSTGEIDGHSLVCAGNVDVAVSTGKTKLTDVSCRSLRSGGSTGNLTMHRVIASERIEIERSTGDVRFEQCDASELLIQTDTGDVTGSLLSEKVFLTESNTGRIEVPKTVNGGKCRITTGTGDIQIGLC